ncbi:hypothetical protein OG372_34420 [Streptomyces sp. NBC_01020]|uniref:hypothetical protein n=1 Tax=unclassified Streptomyces TaxID=2593676 RepID=UPI0032452677|nr:hypothetical protein OG372_34420 [Streptomyces sp. NBC_01020]WSX65577.1 hypothetical protein OG221_02605 [Streptomyces sp. NBC_00932]
MPRTPDTAHGPADAGRRSVLLSAAALALTASGCSGPATRSPQLSAPTASGSAPGSATPSAAALPHTTPWRPNAADVDPQVKLRAVQLIEALGTWRPGGGGVAKARAKVTALGLHGALADQAGPLLSGADEAVLQVIDAQYGGILTNSASVLVVCRQWTRSGGGPVTAGGTTVDVRLSRAQPRWSVTALHPAAPGPASSALSDTARKILADHRISLPPASAADIRSGAVHPTALTALLRLAGSYRIDVSVVRSGHPLDVFGTSRPSDHPLGRAFDVWRINGRPVVAASTPRSLIESFMRDAAAAGSYNVGGPVQLGGGATANQFFSDATHHDHVHAGFNS